MASSYPLEERRLVSKGLYNIVSDIVGAECVVKIRQQRHEHYDTILSYDTSHPTTTITSGSIAEGFNFESSDMDIMHIDNNIEVLHGTSSYIFDKSDIPTVLCMETDNIAPGFALLRCIRYDYRKLIYPTFLVTRGNDVYVSSKIARESHMSSSIRRINGPCSTGVFRDGRENDMAYTLKCRFWPKQANSFIHRSLRHGWPSLDVLTDICKDGCLFVPINSKQQTNSELIDLEWRKSFSVAEKKLIQAMNHSQFLCYGLMKIFLNEVLKKIPETGDLLCSYFMKTAVFCEISENPYNWSPPNFIEKTWNVFSRIMNCVSVGYCPNYFIPEHNMFYDKIYGIHQRNLMLRLRTLYDEGYRCLLRCPSLHEPLSVVINQPFIVNLFSSNENNHSGIIEIEGMRVWSIASCIETPLYTNRLLKTLWNTSFLMPTSDEMVPTIRLRINNILHRIALFFNKESSYRSLAVNKLRYRYKRIYQSILCRTKTLFCMNKVYAAVCSYRNGNYKKTIETVRHIKEKLRGQRYMYTWNLDNDFILECRQQGMTYDTIIKTYVIQSYICEREKEIEELYLERLACKITTGSVMLNIPLLVCLNFLLFISITRLHGISEACVLNELYTLVNYEDGLHIKKTEKAISWEILGICQQIFRDYEGAYQSYVNALNDKYNCFKQATIVRITILVYNLLNQ